MNKKIHEKMLICLILMVMMTNFLASNFKVVYADEEETTVLQKLENGIIIATDVLEDALNVVFGSVIGLLTKPVRVLALGLADGLDDITADLAFSQGTVNPDGSIKPDTIWKDLGELGKDALNLVTLGVFTFKPSISPFDILFNKIALVDIDFFNIPVDGPGSNKIIRNLRMSIASWYYIMRNIAAVILLCVLIYVGIRMAISTVASDKAAFKKMLVDWVCSLALIFLIQYIIIFTISVNSAMVRALQNLSGNDPIILGNSMQSIKMTAKNWFTLDSIAATIVYCMLIGQTLSLLLTYINRMLKVAFLIIISPLITLTYSMDKMGDGKAQALGTWLKEFIYTVIIQTFHCIIYMVFIKMAVSILDSGLAESYNLAGSFLAVMCVKFTKDAEKILGKIFKFGDSTSDASLGVGMALSAAAFSKAGNIGKGTVKAVNGVRNLAHNAGGIAHSLKVSKAALKLRKENSEMTMEEAQMEAEEKISTQEAEKAEKAAGAKYGAGDENYDKAVEDAMQKYADKGFSANTAKQKAIAEVAGQKVKDKKHPTISKFRGKIEPYRETFREFRKTDAYKELAGVARGYAAAGAALAFGATTYGVTGKGVESIFAGASMFKGTQEVFKSSATTMEDTTESMLKGIGVKSEAEAIAEMEMIQAKSDLYSSEDKLNDEIDSLLNFMDDRLQGLDKDGGNGVKKAKNAMRSILASEIKKNPEATTAELMAKVRDKLEKDSSIPSNMKNELLLSLPDNYEGITKAANTLRRKEIYDTMQTASDLNLGPGLFAGMVGKRFRNGPRSSSKVEETGEVRDHSGTIESTEKIIEEQRKEYEQPDTTEERKAKIERDEEEFARDVVQMRDEMLEDVTKVAKELYDEIVDQLNDTSIQLTDTRRRELESDLRALLEMYQEDVRSLSRETQNANNKLEQGVYECLNGTRMKYVTDEQYANATVLKGAIESRMKSL